MSPGPAEATQSGLNGTAAALGPVRWSRRRWTYSVLGLLVLQIALLYVLGKRPRSPASPPVFGMHLHGAEDTWSALQISQDPVLPDPTLFALPSLQGFSSDAWLKFALAGHKFSDWTEPPRWLGFDTNRMGRTFEANAVSVHHQPLMIADLPMPRPTGLDLPVLNQSAATQSLVRVEGDIAARGLLTPLRTRSWTNQELLTNTIVELMVNAEGHPVFAQLLTGSGSREADQWALREAAGARFERLVPPEQVPAPDPRTHWGRMTYQWHTVIPETNAPPRAL